MTSVMTEMQEKASQSPSDEGDTEGGNGRRAMGRCTLIMHHKDAWEHTGSALAERGTASAEHGAELYRVHLRCNGSSGFGLTTLVCVSVASPSELFRTDVLS